MSILEHPLFLLPFLGTTVQPLPPPSTLCTNSSRPASHCLRKSKMASLRRRGGEASPGTSSRGEPDEDELEWDKVSEGLRIFVRARPSLNERRQTRAPEERMRKNVEEREREIWANRKDTCQRDVPSLHPNERPSSLLIAHALLSLLLSLIARRTSSWTPFTGSNRSLASFSG